MVPKLRFKDKDGRNFPDWEKKYLYQVAEIHDTKRAPLSESERKWRKGIYPYYGASGVIDFIDEYIFDGEFVLLSEDGANILTRATRVAFLAHGKFWANNHAHVLKALGSNRFLAEALERISYEKYNTGTVQPKLNIESCKKIKLNIPCLQEQQKIAEFIVRMEQKIALLHDKKINFIHYKQGLMQRIFDRKIRFRRKGGEDFPDWQRVKLGNVLQQVIGGGTPSRKNAGYFDGSIPWATVKDLSENPYKDGTIEYISEAGLENSAAKIVPKNSLIVSTRMGLGRGFINRVDMTINQDMKGLIVDDNRVYVAFLLYWYKNNAVSVKRLGIGSTVKGIDLVTLKSLILDMPGLEEQQKIADFLCLIDQKIQFIDRQLKACRQWKKGLLQKLFI